MWFEFVWNNMKYVENSEMLENPHVLADKFTYVSARLIALGVFKYLCSSLV